MNATNGDLPDQVIRLIDSYYAEPIKLGLNGEPYDIRLSSLGHSEAMTLAQLTYSNSPAHSLEIGLANASSAIAIAAARKCRGLTSQHVALDPYQETLSGSVGLSELSKCNLKNDVQWIAERSENFWARSVGSEKYDFIFIDSAHDIGQTVTDAFYANKVLNDGGLVIFHDSLLFSTSAAVRYLCRECGYQIVSLRPDSKLKRLLRIVKYSVSLGWWYAIHVVPKMHQSLVALRKTQ